MSLNNEDEDMVKFNKLKINTFHLCSFLSTKYISLRLQI